MAGACLGFANLATVDGLVDAIKAKTDDLTFTGTDVHAVQTTIETNRDKERNVMIGFLVAVWMVTAVPAVNPKSTRRSTDR